MRRTILGSALLLAFLPVRLAAASELPVDENKPPPPKVRFYDELGFKDFLAHEPEAPPAFDPVTSTRPQPPLWDVGDWRETVFPKFALHISGKEYYFGQNLGTRNLIGRFFREGYGTELTTYLHLETGVDVFLSLDWGYHLGRRDDLSDVSTKLSSFDSYGVLVGLKPYTSLRSILGDASVFSRRSTVFVRFGAGGTFVEEVRRVAPAPQEVFWNASTLGTLQITLGLEFQLFGEAYLFVENGTRMFTAPNPNRTLRPENETGPFAILIWQLGLFFRF